MTEPAARGDAVTLGSIAAATDRLTDVVTELVACSVTTLEEPEASRVHAALRRAHDTLGIVAARVLARIEDDGRWATTSAGRGARDFEDWVAQASKGSRAGARRQARMARAVREESVPGLAAAVAAGGVTLEHADVLTRLAPTSPARRAALASSDPSRNAAFLLGQARLLGADEFTKEVRRWAARIDPAADEQGHRDASAKVACTLSPRDDGIAVAAFLTAVDGAALDAALTAVAGVPTAGESRSRAQRMGTALGDMARLVLDHGLAAGRSGGFRPHLSVHVAFETLVEQVRALETRSPASAAAEETSEAGAARVGDGRVADGRVADGRVADGRVADGRDLAARPAPTALPDIPAGWEVAVLGDGTPIPASVLARVACDAEVTRIVFGPRSEVLDVGRAERVYPASLRRAVVARDRHCTYPGCHRPPTFGEIHHVRHWAAHQGETSVANGILLCWQHHDLVHSRYLTIERDHTRGRWAFRERDGRPLENTCAEAPAAAARGVGGPAGSTEGERANNADHLTLFDAPPMCPDGGVP
jgi:hypothetical protein